jgi:hypothetical protein
VLPSRAMRWCGHRPTPTRQGAIAALVVVLLAVGVPQDLVLCQAGPFHEALENLLLGCTVAHHVSGPAQPHAHTGAARAADGVGVAPGEADDPCTDTDISLPSLLTRADDAPAHLALTHPTPLHAGESHRPANVAGRRGNATKQQVLATIRATVLTI